MLKKNNINTLVSLLPIIVSSLFIIVWGNIFWYVYLYVLGIYITRFANFAITNLNGVLKYLLSPSWAILYTIMVFSFIDILGIPISTLTVRIFVLVNFLLIIFWVLSQREKKQIHFSEQIRELKKTWLMTMTLFILCGIAIWSLIFSIGDRFAPILHDPMTHTEFARRIVSTGHINFFYSPGLHIISAVGELVGSYHVAKQVLLLTSAFIVIGGINLFIYIKSNFNHKYWALVSMLLFMFATFPAGFFYAAGKNSFVIALSLVPLLLITTSGNFKCKSLCRIILCNLIFYCLFIIHYPTALIAGFLVLVEYIVRKKILGLFIEFIPSVSGILMFIYSKRDLLSNMSQDSLSNNNYSLNFQLKLTEMFLKVKSIYEQISFFIKNDPIDNLVFWLAIGGIVYLTIMAFKEKKYRSLVISIYVLFSLMMLYEISGISAARIRVFYETFILFMMLPIYIFSSYIIGDLFLLNLVRSVPHVKSFAYISIIIIAVMAGSVMRGKYITTHDAINTLYKADIEVFNWIDTNLSNSANIVTNATSNSKKGDTEFIVFPTDSGGWIPGFTDNSVSAQFSKYGDLSTFNNYEQWKILKEMPSNCEALKYFLENDYEYYFHGSRPVYGESLEIPATLLDINYKEVYRSGNAVLYKIIPCP